jgi:DNA-binding response OmpR family regulator
LLPRHTVLVVDPLDETHEVLRTALAHRGVDVVGSRDSARGLALARRHRPRLIVLDVEGDASSAELAGRLASEPANSDTRLVILGKAKRESAGVTACQFSKPYDYLPLIRKIEELLAA